MAIIFRLSMAQMLRPRRLLLLMLVAAIPVGLAAIAQINPPAAEDLADFRDDVLMGPLVISAILPIVIVVLGTASLGHEVEDRTLTYLFLKPVQRWAIVAPKLAATALVGGALVIASGVLTAAITPGGGADGLLAIAAGLAVGVLAYSAVFTWAGLVTSHALAFGLVYVFVWEATVVSFLQGVRWLSVRHYTIATIHGFDNVQFSGDDAMLTLSQALPSAAIVFAVFLALTVRRLRRMDVP